MTKRSYAQDQAVRIELLRARAAVEREALAHSVAAVGQAVSPTALLSSVLPGLVTGKRASWVLRGWGLARRYPLLSSTLSALLMQGGKRFRLLKLGAGGLVAWQLWQAWQEMRAQAEPDERAEP